MSVPVRLYGLTNNNDPSGCYRYKVEPAPPPTRHSSADASKNATDISFLGCCLLPVATESSPALVVALKTRDSRYDVARFRIQTALLFGCQSGWSLMTMMTITSPHRCCSCRRVV